MIRLIVRDGQGRIILDKEYEINSNRLKMIVKNSLDSGFTIEEQYL